MAEVLRPVGISGSPSGRGPEDLGSPSGRGQCLRYHMAAWRFYGLSASRVTFRARTRGQCLRYHMAEVLRPVGISGHLQGEDQRTMSEVPYG